MPSESEPEVRTVSGVLRGCREAGRAVFRGIRILNTGDEGGK